MEHKKEHWLSRGELLLGRPALEKLKNSNILVVGLGGVGAFAAEFLARQGVGKMTVVDGDTVSPTNINRQLAALHSTIGKGKAQLAAERLRDVNPEIELTVMKKFLLPEEAKALVSNNFDFVVDCIDSVSPKLALIFGCMEKGVPLISSMGAGGRFNPEKIHVKDISKTTNCPLAKHLRKRIKAATGKYAKGFAAVYSEELPDPNSIELTDGSDFKKSFYGTASYMPAAFGIHAAAYVITSIIV